ncbi:MAG: glycine--tRNA ligase subunit beta, partial [Pseudomonadota bacterium]
VRSRLADADFFIKKDMQVPLDERIKQLERIRFYDKLGHMKDKALRLEYLSGELASIFKVEKNIAKRAGLLAKIDLTTYMVDEIPKLQGYIGGYYANKFNEKNDISLAISEHYKPLSSHGELPASLSGNMVAIADRIDTLIGFWLIDAKPTGSRDPMALRRAATALVRILIHSKIYFSLNQWLDLAGSLYHIKTTPESFAKIKDDLIFFILERIKILFEGQPFALNILSNLLSEKRFDCPYSMVILTNKLANFLETSNGKKLLSSCRRVDNILRAEEESENQIYQGKPQADLILLDEEKTLWKTLEPLLKHYKNTIKIDSILELIDQLNILYTPIEQFFEKVTVNDPRQNLRKNRLELLACVRNLMHVIIKFSNLSKPESE